ncbi:hypothetical protein Bca4012_058751 [Brassica carinata]|uniref:Ubiquitin-like protease family profile domain-containing protein n=1 Tax=Brassica carinata TaxID=52824 RepID=A0A8X7W6G8_BRACI|nr:hypothetical protein Bca52824_016463 [Brassica carinata]
MLDSNGETNVTEEYQWSDDEDDVGVSNMVKLVDQGFAFTNKCFVGGSTKLDVNRMREEAKAELVNRKTVKTKTSSSPQVQDSVDIDFLASLVKEKLKEDFQLLHGNISTIQESANGFTETILLNISEVYGVVQDCVGQISTLSSDIRKFSATVAPLDQANRQPSVVDAGTQTIPDATTLISDAVNFVNRSTHSAAEGHIESNANTWVSGIDDNSVQPGVQADHSSSQSSQDENLPYFISLCRLFKTMQTLDPALLFPNPTFSLGLTQEARGGHPNHANVTDDTDQEGGDKAHVEATIEEAALGCRQSKRHKVPTKSLMGEYEYDQGFLNRARKAVADAIYKGRNIDYSAKFAALMDKMKTPFDISTERGNIQSTELYEVVERATQLSTKFSGNVVEMLLQLPSYAEAVRFYFPFNLDKKYWVAICVDCSSWSVTVLDCNNALRTYYMMNKEVRPIALMFPYLLKQVGRQLGTRDSKAMEIERPRTIPQQNAVTQSAVSSVLFIQAHAVGGVDACKCFTPDVLDSQVEKLVVTLYEASVGPI